MADAIGVLISGRGSNLQAIIEARREGKFDTPIAVVLSNKPDAAGLERARAAGLPTAVLSHKEWSTRVEYDTALTKVLHDYGVTLVCLAGFMRLLTPTFIDAFPNRVLNVHPSLLPAFPGVDAQRQALEHGVRVSGATVHLVTAELDAGPIVLQSAVPVHSNDTEATLSARILAEEHRLYPEAIRILLSGRWTVVGRRFVCEG